MSVSYVLKVDRASALLRSLTVVDNSVSRRRKRRPDGTTLAANDSLPISDRRSLFVVLCFPSQDLIKRVISCSLSGGNRSCWSAMSMVMPRNVMVVAGPSSLSKATGIPSFSHTLSMVSVDSLQVGCPGGPARRKSSR